MQAEDQLILKGARDSSQTRLRRCGAADLLIGGACGGARLTRF
jgi:hypothetical protein